MDCDALQLDVIHRSISCAHRNLLHLVQHVHPINHVGKDCVLPCTQELHIPHVSVTDPMRLVDGHFAMQHTPSYNRNALNTWNTEDANEFQTCFLRDARIYVTFNMAVKHPDMPSLFVVPDTVIPSSKPTGFFACSLYACNSLLGHDHLCACATPFGSLPVCMCVCVRERTWMHARPHLN